MWSGELKRDPDIHVDGTLEQAIRSLNVFHSKRWMRRRIAQQSIECFLHLIQDVRILLCQTVQLLIELPFALKVRSLEAPCRSHSSFAERRA